MLSFSSLHAASKICELSDWTITNLEIQKILYLANMVFLGEQNLPLIEESFEAWMYGPVVPQLYNKLRIFGADPIKSYFSFHAHSTQSVKEENCLINAWEHLRNKAKWELVGLTHRSHGAWAKVYSPSCNKTIPTPLILEEYRDITYYNLCVHS